MTIALVTLLVCYRLAIAQQGMRNLGIPNIHEQGPWVFMET
jgi:hypothetical protein